MHDILDDGKLVQCVCFGVGSHGSAERKRGLTRDFLEESFKSWLDSPIAKAMVDVKSTYKLC